MTAITEGGRAELHRSIDWKGAFWVASGVPALVLFSIGGIAGTVGIPAYAVWIVSMSRRRRKALRSSQQHRCP